MLPLGEIYNSRRVAVIGASSKPGNLARRIVENLLALGFSGEVYPVGRSDDTLLDLKVFRSVLEIPGPVDLAVIAVPASHVPAALEECGKKNIRYSSITSSGFGEFSDERRGLDERLKAIAGEYGIRFLGPNCQGIRDYSTGLCTRFGKQTKETGLKHQVGLIVQSGTVSSTIERYLKEENIGLTRLASIGNKLDVDEVDLLPVFLKHEPTKIICLYLEGIKRGRELIEVAVGAEKPILLCKGNIAPGTSQIARSHSASILNEQRVVEAAAREAGIVLVNQLSDFALFAKAFSLPPMRGNRLVIFGGSGGMGVIGADWAYRCGFDLVSLPAETAESIERRLPGGYIKVGNPVDIGDFFDMGTTLNMVDEILALPNVDGMVVCIFDPTPGAVGFTNLPKRSFAVEVGELMDCHKKPVALVYAATRDVVRNAGSEVDFSIYMSVDEAIRGLASLRDYWRHHLGFQDRAVEIGPAKPEVRAIVERVRSSGRRSLAYVDGFKLLELAGLEVAMPQIADSAAHAVEIFKKLGTAVAMKLVSGNGSHKTDSGALRLDLKSEEQVRAAFADLQKAGPAPLIAVQAMVPGIELMLGSKRDPYFGPTVSVGLGGVLVELLADAALGLAPVTRSKALRMLNETRAGRVLRGWRGQPPADVESVINALQKLSRLVVEIPEIAEIDVNPLMALPQGHGVRAVDVRVFVG